MKWHIICLMICKLILGKSFRKILISSNTPASVYCLARLAISVIESGGNIGGNRFKKKSFNAVATALTGISNSLILTSES